MENFSKLYYLDEKNFVNVKYLASHMRKFHCTLATTELSLQNIAINRLHLNMYNTMVIKADDKESPLNLQ